MKGLKSQASGGLSLDREVADRIAGRIFDLNKKAGPYGLTFGQEEEIRKVLFQAVRSEVEHERKPPEVLAYEQASQEAMVSKEDAFRLMEQMQ